MAFTFANVSELVYFGLFILNLNTGENKNDFQQIMHFYVKVKMPQKREKIYPVHDKAAMNDRTCWSGFHSLVLKIAS